MRRTNLVAGGLLCALGVVSLVEAWRLRDGWQGAKLMPALVGVVLLALGARHVAPLPGRPSMEAGAWPDAASRRRVVVVFGALVLYVVALPGLGFLSATALFVLAVLRVMASFSWPRIIALTVAIAIASDVVFRRWLGMPLPSGPLGL